MTDSMKSRIRNKLYGRYIFSSPWLLAAAGALLALIIASFALQNYRLEKRLMYGALEQRAGALVRALRSGIRVALVGELQRRGQMGGDWSDQLQQVADHIGDDRDVLFVGIADQHGRILAHSDRARVGRIADDPPVPAESGEFVRYRFVPAEGAERVFSADAACTLFARARGGRMLPRMLEQGGKTRLMPSPPLVWELNRARPQPAPPLPPDAVKLDYRLTVGLDARPFEQGLARLRWQIALLSLTMLLVGLGGWLSLAAVQGYRVSQQTVEKVQSYTALLVAQLPLGVIATTPEGRIETWNAAVGGLTGLAARDALGRLPEEVLPPELAAFFGEGSGAEPRSGAKNAVERLELTLGGERRALLCRPLAITDALQSYRGRGLLLSDITKQDELERQMREAERLAAVGRMAGAVAHEVRNPLSSIRGLAFLLQNKFAEGSRERESAALLVRETERLNRTITEMLELTRPAPPVLSPVDMGALLKQSLALMAAELGEAGITARLDCPDGLPHVLGDADRLRQVLMNVLLNARQAMEGGGELAARLALSADGRFLELTVADTGPGIPPDTLAHVFEPYFTTKPGGSGIGLAVTRKIVTDHRGLIDIESGEGQGATVRVRLPAARREGGRSEN